MSFAIIRNTKHKLSTLNLAFRHNERKNTNYSNKDINLLKGKENFSLKSCDVPYSKRFNQLRNDYHLKGQIKTTSNIACEYIITSDNEFFKEIGLEETKKFFKSAYQFVCGYKNLGEQFIISAKVHMDETTPHMHLVYLPVVKAKDKNDNPIDKLSCTDFWKGKNSYKILQDNFYKYMTRAGFDLERGETEKNEHIPIEKLKVMTNYEMQELEKQSTKFEEPKETNNVEELKEDYKRVIRKFNTLAKQYTKVKVIHENNQSKIEQLEKDYESLVEEYEQVEKNNRWLRHYINKTFECVSVLFDCPIDRLKRIVNNLCDNLQLAGKHDTLARYENRVNRRKEDTT